jgi:hypothetical protein
VLKKGHERRVLTMSLGLVASYGSSSGEESDEEEVSVTGRNNPEVQRANTMQSSVAYPDP